MRTWLIVLLAISVCGLWGCASSKSIDTAAAGTSPVTKTNEIVPASSKSTDTADAAKRAAADQKRPQPLHRSLAAAAKPQPAPTSTPKVKPNDVVVHPETAAKSETKERKPANMKVANGFDRNPYLSSIVTPLLPPRTTVMDAATGFKNQKQFIAAVHLSRNMGIPFDKIKTRMTGEHPMSLNDSLRDLRPEMTKKAAKAEVNKAEDQAKVDESHAKDQAKKAAAQAKVTINGKS